MSEYEWMNEWMNKYNTIQCILYEWMNEWMKYNTMHYLWMNTIQYNAFFMNEWIQYNVFFMNECIQYEWINKLTLFFLKNIFFLEWMHELIN